MELLEIGKVAEMLGCSKRNVARLVDTGGMPAPLKLGGLRRWRRDELAEWIARGCKPVRGVGRVGR